MALEGRLRERAAGAAIFNGEELADLRGRVLRELSAETRPRPHRVRSLTTRLAATLAIGLALAVAFEAGRRRPAVDSGLDPERLVRFLDGRARQHRELAESVAEGYLLTNVRLREIDGETVSAAFDLTTHLEIERSRHDPLIAELVVQSLVGPSSLRTRLQAVALAREAGQPKVRDALGYAALDDPEPAVRSRALATLAELDSDGAEVVGILLAVLEREASTGMRLLALEHLLERGQDRRRLERAVRVGDPAGAAPLLLRLQGGARGPTS